MSRPEPRHGGTYSFLHLAPTDLLVAHTSEGAEGIDQGRSVGVGVPRHPPGHVASGERYLPPLVQRAHAALSLERDQRATTSRTACSDKDRRRARGQRGAGPFLGASAPAVCSLYHPCAGTRLPGKPHLSRCGSATWIGCASRDTSRNFPCSRRSWFCPLNGMPCSPGNSCRLFSSFLNRLSARENPTLHRRGEAARARTAPLSQSREPGGGSWF